MIWLLTDLVTAFTMPLVWIAATEGGKVIGGFTGPQFVAYYVVVLFITNFVTCHFMWEMNFEIREGILSSQLIRPVPWLAFMFARNLAWRVMRTLLFLPWFGIFLIAYGPLMGSVPYSLGWEFWLSILLGHILSFGFVTALGCLALFTEEAQSIFELYYFPMMFLSGQLFPISVLPQWAQNASLFMPFYYTTAVPTEIAIGRLTGPQATQAILGQFIWIAISFTLFHFLWKAGLKRYTGVGM